MKYLIGVDEAGRGSLVGELIVVAFAMPEEDENALIDIGVKDSKKLSPGKRAELYEVLKRRPFSVYSIPPRDIDSESLTKLELKAILKVLDVLSRRLGVMFRSARITVDKFGDIEDDLRGPLSRLDFAGSLVVEEHADDTYVEVSAASIIAKHLRDRRLKVLKSIYGVEGSGYPSDPRTIAWLDKALRAGVKPPIIRYSWATLGRFGLRVKRKARLTYKTLDEYFK